MTNTLFTVATFTCLYAGMAGLCLSMDRHYKQVFGQPPGTGKKRRLYLAGWFLLILSLLYSSAAWGPLFGPVIWTGILTLTAGLLVLLLTYQQKLVAASAAISLALSFSGLLAVASFS